MSYDYRTEHTLTVFHNGETVYTDTSMGSPDIFQLGAEFHYALIYARILNPDLPADAPVTVESKTIYGRTTEKRELSALHPNYEYLIPEVLARHAARAS